MSWDVELSHTDALQWPVPINSPEYSSDWMSQHRLPAWLATRQSQTSFDTTAAAWDIFAAEVFSKLPTELVSRQRDSLWLFSGASATTAAARLSPLLPTVYAAIRKWAQRKNTWSESVLRSDVLNIGEETSKRLSTLDTSTIGVVRVYEWGKF